MRAVVQRVSSASVVVAAQTVGEIDTGLLVYVGVEQGDTDADVLYLKNKITGLRIFEGDDGKMRRSVIDIGGAVLLVSQFTLLGDVRSGLRPDFGPAEAPEKANVLYEQLVSDIRQLGLKVETGRFRESMVVSAAVVGPVTILLDSRKRF